MVDDSAAAVAATTCVECGKRFKWPQGLWNHMEFHRGLTACSLCHKTFSTRHNLRHHMRRMHPNADVNLSRSELGGRLGSI